MGRSLPHTVLAALGLQDTEEGLCLSSDVHFKQILALPHYTHHECQCNLVLS